MPTVPNNATVATLVSLGIRAFFGSKAKEKQIAQVSDLLLELIPTHNITDPKMLKRLIQEARLSFRLVWRRLEDFNVLCELLGVDVPKVYSKIPNFDNNGNPSGGYDKSVIIAYNAGPVFLKDYLKEYAFFYYKGVRTLEEMKCWIRTQARTHMPFELPAKAIELINAHPGNPYLIPGPEMAVKPRPFERECCFDTEHPCACSALNDYHSRQSWIIRDAQTLHLLVQIDAFSYIITCVGRCNSLQPVHPPSTEGAQMVYKARLHALCSAMLAPIDLSILGGLLGKYQVNSKTELLDLLNGKKVHGKKIEAAELAGIDDVAQFEEFKALLEEY